MVLGQDSLWHRTVDCDVAPMSVCHLLLGRPWQFDKAVTHDGRTNYYSFKWNNKILVLRPMTPSQIIADNAKTIVRTQEKQSSSELSGERANHIHVSESQKPNMSEKGKRVSPGIVLLATKSEAQKGLDPERSLLAFSKDRIPKFKPFIEDIV